MKLLDIDRKTRARQTESSIAMGLTGRFDNLEVVLSGSPKRKNLARDQFTSTCTNDDLVKAYNSVHAHPATQQVRVKALVGTNPVVPLTQ